MFEELSRPTKDKDRQKSKAYATITTNFGPLNVELHGDRAPKTVYNFVQLAKAGKYDNVVFHRLIPGFMDEGESRIGVNRLEMSTVKRGHINMIPVSMANSGPRTNGSQFFFTFRPTPHLDGKHTVFGKLVGGEETLDKIERVNVRPGGDRPVRDIVILGVSVLQDPFEAYQARLQARLARQDQSDAALKRRAEAQKEREKDRTTWLGTNLGGGGGGGGGGEKVEATARRQRLCRLAPGVARPPRAVPPPPLRRPPCRPCHPRVGDAHQEHPAPQAACRWADAGPVWLPRHGLGGKHHAVDPPRSPSLVAHLPDPVAGVPAGVPVAHPYRHFCVDSRSCTRGAREHCGRCGGWSHARGHDRLYRDDGRRERQVSRTRGISMDVYAFERTGSLVWRFRRLAVQPPRAVVPPLGA
ncbi:peptidyl-prolyl cis-trans isomerase-like 2 [Cryptococcus neoformans]|nr:peptidyl-prolyl cis-trans isomerase-like 2 [Cryptococcus neoformans var. grubii]